MKSRIILFLLVLAGLQVYGQSGESRFKPGAKIGFNVSSFTRDVAIFDQPDEAYSSFKNSVRLSFMAGITLDMEMANSFTLGMELLYNSRGMSYSQKNDRVVIETEGGQTKNAYNNYEYQLDYLELPLTVNYNFKPESANKYVKGYLGIAPAVALRKKSVLTYPKSDPEHDKQKADLSDVRSFTKSIITGVKLGESYAENELYIDFRGSYMPDKVFTQRIDDSGKNLDTHMFTFTFSFGFKF